MSDLDVLKEIPGYKAILKSVLKSQIQLLMEQLSEHAGEESIILTASVNDGSLSHLGSSTGKGFFEGRDEIKSQFLGYCLKTYHKQKTREPPKPYQRKHPSPRTSPSTQPAKRPCVYPVSLSQYSSETYPSSNIETHRLPERRTSQEQTDSTMDLAVGTSGDSSSDTIVKTELNDQNTSNSGPTAVTSAAEFLPSSIHLSHTQGSSETNEGADNENTKNDSSDETRIKVEQLEDELEITGVEMAAGSINHWGQGQPGYIPESDSSYSMPSDQSGYRFAPKKKQTTKAVAPTQKQTIATVVKTLKQTTKPIVANVLQEPAVDMRVIRIKKKPADETDLPLGEKKVKTPGQKSSKGQKYVENIREQHSILVPKVALTKFLEAAVTSSAQCSLPAPSTLSSSDIFSTFGSLSASVSSTVDSSASSTLSASDILSALGSLSASSGSSNHGGSHSDGMDAVNIRCVQISDEGPVTRKPLRTTNMLKVIHKCAHCGKSFHERKDLTEHMKSHERRK